MFQYAWYRLFVFPLKICIISQTQKLNLHVRFHYRKCFAKEERNVCWSFHIPLDHFLFSFSLYTSKLNGHEFLKQSYKGHNKQNIIFRIKTSMILYSCITNVDVWLMVSPSLSGWGVGGSTVWGCKKKVEQPQQLRTAMPETYFQFKMLSITSQKLPWNCLCLVLYLS